MAMSHILWRYALEERTRGISLVLTHVHHGVRKESDDEVTLVQTMAAKWEIPCIVHRFDSKSYAKAMGQSYQEAAREWRYARWKEDMRKEGCALLATAHHLGDQAETILYRLIRGSGTAGLAGIYPNKDSIIRPLLTFGKAEILNYCVQEALPYALDHSNDEPVYIRNRIRLELIPELKNNYNPRIQEVLGRTGEVLRWDEEYLAQQVEVAWKHYSITDHVGKIGLIREVFNEPAAILSRLLRRAAMMITQEPRGLGFNYVVKIMNSEGKPGWKQDLPGLTVNISDESIWFRPYAGHRGQHCAEMESYGEIALEIGSWSEIPRLKSDIGLLKEGDFASMNETCKSGENKMATFSRDLLDQLPDLLVCRTRRRGDKMWFRGIGHKSLKKVFQEENVPVDVRNELPLIASGAEVLWIPGVRQSGLCQPDQKTERVYCVLKPQASASNLNSL